MSLSNRWIIQQGGLFIFDIQCRPDKSLDGTRVRPGVIVIVHIIEFFILTFDQMQRVRLVANDLLSQLQLSYYPSCIQYFDGIVINILSLVQLELVQLSPAPNLSFLTVFQLKRTDGPTQCKLAVLPHCYQRSTNVHAFYRLHSIYYHMFWINFFSGVFCIKLNWKKLISTTPAQQGIGPRPYFFLPPSSFCSLVRTWVSRWLAVFEPLTGHSPVATGCSEREPHRSGYSGQLHLSSQ